MRAELFQTGIFRTANRHIQLLKRADLQATSEVTRTCEAVLRTLVQELDKAGVLGTDDSAPFTQAQAVSIRSTCVEAARQVRTSLKAASSAAERRPEPVSATGNAANGQPPWQGVLDSPPDAERPPLSQKGTFTTKEFDQKHATVAQPLSQKGAGAGRRAEECRGGKVEVAASRQPAWEAIEGQLAELPCRLANVALVLKVHVLPAMAMMPSKEKDSILVCSCFLPRCAYSLILTLTCSHSRRVCMRFRRHAWRSAPTHPGWSAPTKPGQSAPTNPGWSAPTNPGWSAPTNPGPVQEEVEAVAEITANAAAAITAAQAAPAQGNSTGREHNCIAWMPRHLATQHALGRRKFAPPQPFRARGAPQQASRRKGSLPAAAATPKAARSAQGGALPAAAATPKAARGAAQGGARTLSVTPPWLRTPLEPSASLERSGVERLPGQVDATAGGPQEVRLPRTEPVTDGRETGIDGGAQQLKGHSSRRTLAFDSPSAAVHQPQGTSATSPNGRNRSRKAHHQQRGSAQLADRPGWNSCTDVAPADVAPADVASGREQHDDAVSRQQDMYNNGAPQPESPCMQPHAREAADQLTPTKLAGAVLTAAELAALTGKVVALGAADQVPPTKPAGAVLSAAELAVLTGKVAALSAGLAAAARVNGAMQRAAQSLFARLQKVLNTALQQWGAAAEEGAAGLQVFSDPRQCLAHLSKDMS